MSNNEFAQFLGIDSKQLSEIMAIDFKDAIISIDKAKKFRQQIPILMTLCKISYSEMAKYMGVNKSTINRRLEKPETWSDDELKLALKALEKKWPY